MMTKSLNDIQCKVGDGAHLVEIENQVEFTDVVEIFIENFDKVVNGFQICQIVVCDIDTDTEVETSVTTIDYLEVSELHKHHSTVHTIECHTVHY